MYTWWGLYRSVPYESVIEDSDRVVDGTEESQEASHGPAQVCLSGERSGPGLDDDHEGSHRSTGQPDHRTRERK